MLLVLKFQMRVEEEEKTSLKVLLNSILFPSARSNDVELQDRGWWFVHAGVAMAFVDRRKHQMRRRNSKQAV